MTPLDVLLISTLGVVILYLLIQPVPCKHTCPQCTRERAEKIARERKVDAQYEHENGLDRRYCPVCGGWHCGHEGCKKP